MELARSPISLPTYIQVITIFSSRLWSKSGFQIITQSRRAGWQMQGRWRAGQGRAGRFMEQPTNQPTHRSINPKQRVKPRRRRRQLPSPCSRSNKAKILHPVAARLEHKEWYAKCAATEALGERSSLPDDEILQS
jgi:hypothetical protein